MNAVVDIDRPRDQSGAKIIIAAFGTLGAVHPCLAIGLALQARGFSPVLAVSADHTAKVVAAGLEAAAIMPPAEAMAAAAAAELSITAEETWRRVMEDEDFMIRRVMIDYLAGSVAALQGEIAGAVAIVGTRTTLAGPILAEKYGIPFIELQLQPMALFSADDPPLAKGMEVLTRLPIKPLRMAWNRVWIMRFLKSLRGAYAPGVDAVRTKLGLSKVRSAPFFQIDIKPLLSLGLWSAAFAPVPADYAGRLQLTGFPDFDSNSGQHEALDEELQAFLADGSPPLVFTLGSMAVNAPGGFFAASSDAARALGRRAVFLTGRSEVTGSKDILVRDYVAHSLLFPHAAAIIHHGGMGTTAQALRHGIPQLIVPHFLDQPDNGRRVQKLGVGDVLPVAGYTSEVVSQKLATLLDDGRVKLRAVALAQAMADEDGGACAADLITASLAARSTVA